MLIIDRFEGKWAVIEYGDVTFNVPREILPKGASVGDVLKITIKIDAKATVDRTKTIGKLENDLFE